MGGWSVIKLHHLAQWMPTVNMAIKLFGTSMYGYSSSLSSSCTIKEDRVGPQDDCELNHWTGLGYTKILFLGKPSPKSHSTITRTHSPPNTIDDPRARGNGTSSTERSFENHFYSPVSQYCYRCLNGKPMQAAT